MKRLFLAFSACVLWFSLAARIATADVILSPTAVLLNTGGEFNATVSIDNTINRSGLTPTFVSGVTDFDAYLAGGPAHRAFAIGFEWATPYDVFASVIIYDLGAEYAVGRMALWNDESAGISRFTAQGSNDPAFGSFVALGAFSPADNPQGLDYRAEVFDLTDASVRYVRLEVAGPQIPSSFDGVGMGEIAFAVVPTAPVPEPGALALLACSGLAGAGAALRRLRRR